MFDMRNDSESDRHSGKLLQQKRAAVGEQSLPRVENFGAAAGAHQRAGVKHGLIGIERQKLFAAHGKG